MKFSYTFPKYKWTNWLNGTTLILQPSIKYSKYGTTSYSFSPSKLENSPKKPLFSCHYPAPSKSSRGHFLSTSVNDRFLDLHRTQHAKICRQHNGKEMKIRSIFYYLQLSTISPSIRVAYHQRYPQHDQHVEANCLLSFSEITPSIILERRLTKYSRIGIQCLFSWPSCLLQATIRFFNIFILNQLLRRIAE